MSEDYEGPERRKRPILSDEEIEHIATKAAEIAVQKMTQEVYASVGKSVVQKAYWLIGAVVTALVIGNVSLKELLK